MGISAQNAACSQQQEGKHNLDSEVTTGQCKSIRLSHVCNGRMHQEQLSSSLSWKDCCRVSWLGADRNGSEEECNSRQLREALHQTTKWNVLGVSRLLAQPGH